MPMVENEILFRLRKDGDGNEINLSNMSIDVADQFQEFLKLFTDLAKQYDQNNDIKINVHEGSAALKLFSGENSSTINVIDQDLTDICEDRLINPDSAKIIRLIQDKVKSIPYNIELDVVLNNETKHYISHFKRDRRFKVPTATRKKCISSIEFIKGEMETIGGKSINFHVYENELITHIVRCKTKEEAKRVGQYIFSEVYVAIQKNQTSSISNDFVDIYNSLNDFDYYRRWYLKIQSLIGVERYDFFYDTIELILNDSNIILEKKLKKIRKHLRLLDSKNTEPGMLRTILISIENFKSNQIITPTYEHFLELLKNVKR